MNRYFKRIITGAFIVPLLGFIYILCAMYFYDPLQLFSEKYPDKYNNDNYGIRLYSKRLIDKSIFDSVVIGSSMLTQTDSNEFENGKYINLSFEGSTFKGRAIILSYLLNQNNNIKHIVTTYDGFWEGDFIDFNNIEFAYNNSIKDKFQYYFKILSDKKYLYCFFLLSASEKCIGGDIKVPVFTLNDRKTLNDNFLLKNNEIEQYILKITQDNNHDKYSLGEHFKSLNSFVYSKDKIALFNDLISLNPNVKFHILIPPYPTFSIKNLGENNINDFLKHYKIGLRELLEYRNVIVYGFGLEDFTNNLRNYYDDLWHYRHWINSYMVKAINEGTNIITKDNIDEYLEKFIKKVENYDIKAYEEALKLDIRE